MNDTPSTPPPPRGASTVLIVLSLGFALAVVAALAAGIHNRALNRRLEVVESRLEQMRAHPRPMGGPPLASWGRGEGREEFRGRRGRWEERGRGEERGRRDEGGRRAERNRGGKKHRHDRKNARNDDRHGERNHRPEHENFEREGGHRGFGGPPPGSDRGRPGHEGDRPGAGGGRPGPGGGLPKPASGPATKSPIPPPAPVPDASKS